MTFDKIYQLLKSNTTVKLITVDNAPLITGFLFKTFKQSQSNTLSNTIVEKDLVSLLTDYLFQVNQDEILYPKHAKDYLTDWTNAGFLRKYPGKWLKNKQFYYWGDIDAQGFQILNQCRNYFPNTVAVMMDEPTLNSFRFGEGKPATNQNLERLSESELKLYNHLRQHNIRLEQEKITQTFAEDRINKLLQEQLSYI